MNYLIDCGTHLGEGLTKHIEKYKINCDWTIYSFEANPYTFDLLNCVKQTNDLPKKYNWLFWDKLIRKNEAVWIEDGIVKFYPSKLLHTSTLVESDFYKHFMSYHDSLLANGELITDHQRQNTPIDGSSTILVEHFKEYLPKAGNILQKNIVWDTMCKVKSFNFSNWLKQTIPNNSFVICKLDIEGAEFDVLEQCIKDNTISLINVLNVEFHHFDNKELINRYNVIIEKLKKYNIELNGW